ncbi:MAG: MFS transporter [Actinomycetota bacterium]
MPPRTDSASPPRGPRRLPDALLTDRRLLRRNPAFRRLFLARVVSNVGDMVALTALLLYVEATVGEGVAVSALLLAQAIPNGLLGPIVGTVADRVDHRTLMIISDAGRIVIFVIMAATLPPLAVLLVLFVLAGVLEALFRPAGRSAIPVLVEPHELMTANSWFGVGMTTGAAIGPLIGGVLVAQVGVGGALYVNAGTFLLSIAFLMRVPSLPPEETEGEERLGFLATTREGLAFARRDVLMRAVILGLVLGVAAGGLDNVALVFMATDVFDAEAIGYGVLSGAFGIGMIAATMYLVRYNRPGTAAALFIIGWFGTALGNFGVGVAPVIGLAVAAQLIGGWANGISVVASDTLLQENVPRSMMGRAFGVAGSAPYIGMLIAYGSGGFLVDGVGPRGTFIVSGVATLLIAFAVWAMLNKATSGRQSASQS